MSQTAGGGPKKVLYTLNTVRRIGIKKAAKALSAKNTCKACGLGMGGQRGGMTNELDEFPSVCNKSIQAQSTDIQPPIPLEIFDHSLDDLKELSGHELEHLGRLNTPLHKKKDADRYTPISWDQALQIAAEKFSQTAPDRSFFYSSGRSSNEAGFLLQLVARLYGTNNVNNCSYYCHQATGVGLGSTIGTGTATVELADLKGCDLVFLIGANPASNHPRLIHQLKALRDRGGDVVVINPVKEPGLVKFAVPKSPKSMLIGGDYIASHYLQPKIGADIALLKGIAKAVLSKNNHEPEFIAKHTLAFDAFRDDVDGTSWEDVCHTTGLTQVEIEKVADMYAASKNTVFAWGMGVTHHVHGCENVECIANLALLRGMIGRPMAGLLPLRGHSNVQGIGTIGVKPVLTEDIVNKMETELGIDLPRSRGMDTLACLESAAEGKIDSALIMGGNLYGASPDTTWSEQALGNIGFKLYLTTTLNTGHVHGIGENEVLVLPVLARDEEAQPTTQESMFNYVRLSDGGIERFDNLKSEVEILASLAKQIVPESPIDFNLFKAHQHIREAIAKCIPGMAELKDIAVAKREFHIQGRLMHTPVFNTESGRASFVVENSNHRSETGESEHAFTLATVRSEGQFNTIIYEEEDSYRDVTDRWSVLMNTGDMSELGIEEGAKVDIESDFGEMRALKVKAFDVPKGNLVSYYPESNILIGRQRDPRSQTPAFKSIEVSLKHSSV